ncbi:MAG: sensor histidine kinase, partial [Anaerotignum sp.]
TYGIYLCMIFAIFFFGMYLAGELRSSAKKVAVAAVAAEGVLILVQLVPCLLDLTVIYDTMLYWRYGQMIVSAVLLLCCFYEFRKKGQMDRKNLFSSILMLFAILAEVLNFMAGWWTEGLCLKLMFLLQFLFYVCRSFTSIPEKYRTSVDAEQLEEELKNSRIILAMGQIRTHFIFNVLNAISGMCKYDPEKADETIVRFARYLRGNIDILQNDRPISFSAEIKHLEDYIVLEQMRFGDEKIKYIRETEIEDFFLPPLVLQPIVENAIKHGLLPKEEGGTISLRTWTDGKDIFITIEDDGVGFDLQSLSENTQSIGLDNVRFRLMHMIHGRMEIQTEIGKGTVVTMMIPCKEGLKCM